MDAIEEFFVFNGAPQARNLGGRRHGQGGLVGWHRAGVSLSSGFFVRLVADHILTIRGRRDYLAGEVTGAGPRFLEVAVLGQSL